MHPFTRPKTTALVSTVALVGAITALAAQPSSRVHVVEGTGEASLTQPRVHVQLRDAGGNVLEGEGVEIEGFDIVIAEAGATSFPAFLDTGASAFVISGQTAERFGIVTDTGSVYYEVGAHGETAMNVSEPYEISIGESAGLLDDQPKAFRIVERKGRMQLNTSAAAGGSVANTRGAIDVVGMPAIKHFVVELDLTAMLKQSDASKNALDNPGGDALDQLLEGIGNSMAIGPAVHLHKPATRMRGADYVIPLEYRDFNRRTHPHNEGELPSLASNPMITNVESERDGNDFKSDWLLDTGAAASIISTRHAAALGLLDSAGGQVVEPTFYLPIAGISGRAEMIPGYVIDKVRLHAGGSRAIEFRNVSVLVKDISTVTDSGDLVTLDGVFGMNLLMPSATGLAQGWPTGIGAAPFRRIWVDGPKGRLGLEVAP